MSISIQNLHIEYSDQLVFESVNLDVADNEIIAIRTEVLDGATSLLKGIAGFLTGVRGQVMLNGLDLLENTEDEQRFKIGYVYEEHGLVSLYSTYQNIALPLQFHTDLSKDEIHHKVLEVCQLLNINEAVLERRPHQLNDVQTRLINLARALVVKPEVLLIDELEGGMSDDLLKDTIAVLRQQQANHPMAILITTASDIVMRQADRAFIIQDFGLIPTQGLTAA